ncbi:MAG: hypothetical protein SFV18_03655 [Bryobacteraceae bacterium]|nr:hypothetical protein [Bryobacteraceae bacterium]
MLRCRLRDDVGKAVGQINTTVATSGVVPSMARAPYAPGETWTDRVDRIPQKENGGVPAKAEVDAVFVLFADGSTWGDDKMNQAVTLRGMQRGAAMERMLLKRQLKEGGTAAVERFLQSER